MHPETLVTPPSVDEPGATPLPAAEPAPPDATWSQVEVAAVAGRSRLVRSRSVVPLHILNPASQVAACHVVLAGYGGGLVQGDCVRLQVTVGEGAALYLGTQANTRIFKTPDRPTTAQELVGKVGAGALAVVLPDPVVPHAGSVFRQTQQWDVAAGGRLVLADWLSAGRSESGEQFAFASYQTHVELRHAGRLALVDDYTCAPATHPPRHAVGFGEYDHWLSVYFCGDGVAPLLTALGELAEAWRDEGGGRRRLAVSVLAGGQRGIVRALARTREDLLPLLTRLYELVADPAWLAFNPLSRKY